MSELEKFLSIKSNPLWIAKHTHSSVEENVAYPAQVRPFYVTVLLFIFPQDIQLIVITKDVEGFDPKRS